MTTYTAIVRADSIHAGHRLTTIEATIPRIVLAELNTHRALSRNSASSRAIPVHKQIRKVLEDPFIPEEFGGHQPGMQSAEPVIDEALGTRIWLAARDAAVRSALDLLVGWDRDRATPESDKGRDIAMRSAMENPDWVEAFISLGGGAKVHKEIVNRLLEPFMWHTVLISATEWDNFFALRCHPDAQPQIRRAAEAIRAALDTSTPTELGRGQWHTPFVDASEGLSPSDARVVSVARCARVSYETHGEDRGIEADTRLYERLERAGHWSPFEHVALADPFAPNPANFRGWVQLRHWGF